MTSETGAAGTALRISEIFGPTVQGEGALIGRPTVFVRVGGCDYRCAWCDTLYAVLPEYRDRWQGWAAGAVLDEVDRLAGGPILVSLSGGNPALQDLGPLIGEGHRRGHAFALETQGSLGQPWFAELDHLTLSPKGPSSGHLTTLGEIEGCLQAAGDSPATVLKVVVFDDGDFDYARELAGNFRELPVYLQVGNPEPEGEPDPSGLMARYRWLVERVLEARWYDVTVLPQLHVLAWGNTPGV
ncbi:MAG TPA: 7-carboxy-7-deazaguanine synthase QueE [Gammaproteobacteria bacterium]|nr:7-carboxy-7-deazaguanine synthase QueE [Gammaproteobacteria bacterium]